MNLMLFAFSTKAVLSDMSFGYSFGFGFHQENDLKNIEGFRQQEIYVYHINFAFSYEKMSWSYLTPIF